jgi:hypothetical protein
MVCEPEVPADLRQISPISFPSLVPADVGPRPSIELVDPRKLFVEDRYQRNLSERSVSLIARIVTGFDWRAFKPPIVARRSDGVCVIIDGQHTAIGAASNPNVDLIPVVMVDAAEISDRAGAFLRHNRDRVGMTYMQIHHAAVAAGDEVAVAVEDACRRAGARILRWPTANAQCAVGDTMAVTTISKICSKKGVAFTARLLKILVEAGQAPIEALAVNAVYELLTDADWRGKFEPESLSLVIRQRAVKEWAQWAEVNVRKGLPMTKARALAQAWWSKVPKKGAA